MKDVTAEVVTVTVHLYTLEDEKVSEIMVEIPAKCWYRAFRPDSVSKVWMVQIVRAIRKVVDRRDFRSGLQFDALGLPFVEVYI
mgnify:CR=1 FL=1